MEATKKERKEKKKKKSYVVWPDSLHPSMDKTIRATLLYSQFFITINYSGTYTRVRVSPRWAYNILSLLGHYININLISLTINIYSD